jgi:hypothetical protein
MIEAKSVNQNGHVTTVQLPDDPSDSDLIKALGGGDNCVSLAQVGDWEVLRVSGQTNPTLVVGAAPPMSAETKRRKTCPLADSKIIALVRFLDDWL